MEIERKSDGNKIARAKEWNDSQFATHLYQTSSKSSIKSRLRILETLKILCFLMTTGLNIDAFSMLQIRVDHLHLTMD